MNRREGSWDFYSLQFLTEGERPDWVEPNWNCFGCPPQFEHLGSCPYEVIGKKEGEGFKRAKKALGWMKKRHPRYKWRLIRVVGFQKTMPIE